MTKRKPNSLVKSFAKKQKYFNGLVNAFNQLNRRPKSTEKEIDGGTALFRNIKKFREFKKRVEVLCDDDYIERDLEELPTTVFGGFAHWRRDEFLRLASVHPEYHIVSCIDSGIYLNFFVENALMYFLAEGDSDPCLIHDVNNTIDALYLSDLNSGRSRFRA